MIPEDRLTKALTLLAQTDEGAARLRGRVLALEKKEKTVLAEEFLKHSGTMAEKEARARTSEAFRNWLAEYEDAVLDFEVLKVERSHEELVVEVWRTDSANKRRGNI